MSIVFPPVKNILSRSLEKVFSGISLRDALTNQLFGSGAIGALYDPSNLSTMYQGFSGTPVTGADQPVRLILDVSQGLELGPELWLNEASTEITNSVGSTGYSSADPVTIGNSTIGANNSYPRFTWRPLSSDKVYRIEGRLSGDIESVNGVHVSSPIASNAINYDPVTGKFNGKAYATDDRIIITTDGTSIFEIEISEMSIREIKGNHATAPSNAARPMLRTDGTYWWLEFDGVDDVLSFSFPGTDKLMAALAFELVDESGYAITEIAAPNRSDSLYILNEGDGSFTSRILNTGFSTSQSSSFPVVTGVAIISNTIYDGSSFTVEKDGALIGSASETTWPDTAVSVGAIGANTSLVQQSPVKLYAYVLLAAAPSSEAVDITNNWLSSKSGVTL